MIRSSASIVAQDVTVRCRVRRSQSVLNECYNEPAQDMICTLRNWEQPPPSRGHRLSLTSRLHHHHHHHYSTSLDGPELLLTPEPVVVSLRDVSPLRHHQRQEHQQQTPPPVPFSIPIADILVVETRNNQQHRPARSSAATVYQLTVTTRSFGVFELICDGVNGHDILLAFLHASLPAERILDHGALSSRKIIRPSGSNVSMDGFTARKVQERGDNETWPEKLSRRVGKVVSSFQEMSLTLCDVSSCCQQVQAELLASRHGGGGASGSSSQSYRSSSERRDPPAVHYNDLGLEEEETSSWSSPSVATSNNTNKGMKKGPPKWQSELSMESESEFESMR